MTLLETRLEKNILSFNFSPAFEGVSNGVSPVRSYLFQSLRTRHATLLSSQLLTG